MGGGGTRNGLDSMPEDSLLERLKKRKLVQWALAYLAVGFAVFQSVEVMAVPWSISQTVQRAIHLVLLAGLLVTLIIAWYHGERGEQRVKASEIFLILGVFLLTGLAVRSARSTHPGPSLSPSETPRLPRVAVLPCVSSSPSPGESFPVEGLHGEILLKLQKISSLVSIGMTSVRQFAETSVGTREIAESLGASYVGECTVQRSDNRIRVVFQLLDREGAVKWGDEYEKDITLENVLDIQIDIAREIASHVGAILTPDEASRIQVRPTENRQAYEEGLRGWIATQEHTREGYERAITHFDRAVALDSAYARAFVGLGHSYKELSRTGQYPEREGYARAIRALDRAIDLDPGDGEAFAVLASTRFVAEWDPAEADTLFQEALRLSPESPEVLLQYTQFLTWTSRTDEGIQVALQAAENDPLNPLTTFWVAVAYFYANRYQESISQIRKTMEIEPGFLWAHMYLSHNYVLLGMMEEAAAHADSVLRISELSGNQTIRGYIASDLASCGREETARELLPEALELFEAGQLDAVSVGLIFASLGETDTAFEWFEKAVDQRTGLAFYLPLYGRTFLSGIRSDPRFEALVQRLGIVH